MKSKGKNRITGSITSKNGSEPQGALDKIPDRDESEKQKGKTKIIGKRQAVHDKRRRFGLAMLLLKKIGPIKCVDKEWYRYSTGAWNEVSKRSFDGAALDIQEIDTRNELTAKRLLEIINMSTQVGRGSFRKAVTWEDSRQQVILINVLNGVVRVDLKKETHELIEHSEKFMFINQLPVTYNRETRCDVFKRVMEDVLPDKQDHLLLRYWSAHCFLPDASLESCLICVGDAGSGKSTLLLYGIGSIFGSGTKTSISLQQLCRESDELRHLPGSLINIATEIDHRLTEDSSNLKLLVSGEQIMICPKYISSYELTVTTKFCFLSNRLPQFKRGSDAETRRIRIIHFPKSITEEAKDPTIKRKVAAEADGIFMWLIDSLCDVCKLTEMVRGGELSEKSFEIFKIHNNPVEQFVKKYCLRGPDDLYVVKYELIAAYKAYVKEANVTVSLNDKLFWQTLYAAHPELHKEPTDKKYIKERGKQERVIKGIQLTREAMERFVVDTNSKGETRHRV